MVPMVSCQCCDVLLSGCCLGANSEENLLQSFEMD
jgi:hypothetical protein